MQPCGWYCPRTKGQGAKKEVFFTHRILDFHFFSLFFFSPHGSAWYHLQCDSYDLNVKFLIFFKKLHKVHSVEVLSHGPRQQKGFYLTHNYKYGVKIWAMYAQLDLEVMCRRSPKKRRPSNFHEFWNIEVHSREHPKKAKLWCLNVIISYLVHIVVGPCAKGHFIHAGSSSEPGVLLLLPPMEFGAENFWGWFPTR